MSRKKEEKKLLTISSVGGKLKMDIDLENFKDYAHIKSESSDAHDQFMESPHAETVMPLFMLTDATSILLADFAKDSGTPPADALMLHISALASIFVDRLTEDDPGKWSEADIGALKQVGMSLSNALITIYLAGSDEIGFKISNNIGEMMGDADIANNPTDRGFCVIETLMPALAFAAREAIDHGADKRDILTHLTNSFAAALKSVMPEIEVSSGVDVGRKPDHRITPPTKKNGGSLPS